MKFSVLEPQIAPEYAFTLFLQSHTPPFLPLRSRTGRNTNGETTKGGCLQHKNEVINRTTNRFRKSRISKIKLFMVSNGFRHKIPIRLNLKGCDGVPPYASRPMTERSSKRRIGTNRKVTSKRVKVNHNMNGPMTGPTARRDRAIPEVNSVSNMRVGKKVIKPRCATVVVDVSLQIFRHHNEFHVDAIKRIENIWADRVVPLKVSIEVTSN